MENKLKCKHCAKYHIKLVLADPPWHDQYYICTYCQSTYNFWEYNERVNHDENN